MASPNIIQQGGSKIQDFAGEIAELTLIAALSQVAQLCLFKYRPAQLQCEPKVVYAAGNKPNRLRFGSRG
jgi:hypothetical protein